MIYFIGLISYIRFLPHLLFFLLSSKRNVVNFDIKQWNLVVLNKNESSVMSFLWLLNNLKEFRTVFYYRLGNLSFLLNFFAKGQVALYINTPNDKIGNGLVFQHGFSTIVNAKSIGNNVQIWHNVTIGVSKSHTEDKPIIGNNVKISAGAIVLGNISIGDNCTIGAGAVITKSVPPNAVVVGNPPYIIRLNENIIKLKL